MNLPDHFMGPIPADALALPTVQELSQVYQLMIKGISPGKFDERFFPPITFNFSHLTRPLYDPELDNKEEDPRGYAERTLNAVAGFAITDYISSTQYSGFPVNSMVLGWGGALLDQNWLSRYWNVTKWKYERAFFIKDKSWWWQKHVYPTPEIDVQDGQLWEYATNAGNHPPVIAPETPAPIVRYYSPRVKTEASEITTMQLNAIGVDPLVFSRCTVVNKFVETNEGFNEITECAKAAEWCKNYNAPFTLPTYGFWPQGLVCFNGSLLDMADMARQWTLRFDSSSIDGWVPSQVDQAYRGAMFGQLNTQFLPMFETPLESGVIPRAVNAEAPFKNVFAFGDFHGLAYSLQTAVSGQETPIWKTLLKVQRHLHYFRPPWRDRPADIGDKVKFFIPDTTDPFRTMVEFFASSAVLDWGINCIDPNYYVSPFYNSPTEDPELFETFYTGAFPQIIGFSEKQALEQFPERIIIGGISDDPIAYPDFSWTTGQGNTSQTQQAFFYDNRWRTVSGISGSEKMPSGYLPFETPNDCVRYSPGGVFFNLVLKKKIVGGVFVGYEIESANGGHVGNTFVQYEDRNEFWYSYDPMGPEPEVDPVAQLLADSFAAFFTDIVLNKVTACGSFEIYDKDGVEILNTPLWGIEEIGIPRIKWTAVDTV